jgi:flagellar assembly factor FliW
LRKLAGSRHDLPNTFVAQFSTSHFGVVEFSEEAVIHFPEGLAGFEDETRFLTIEPAASNPVVFLQSLARTELTFVTLPIHTIDPAYRLQLSPADRRTLGLVEEDAVPEQDLLCLAIVCLRDDGSSTANLLGPLVIQRHTRRSVQAIRGDSLYSAEHVLGAAEPPCS